MKLEEAIEIKKRTGEEFLHTDPDEIEEADRLVIEAGKSVEHSRLIFPDVEVGLLPGETKD